MLKAAAAQVAARQAGSRVFGELQSLDGILAVNKPSGISCSGLLDYFKRNIGRGHLATPFRDHFEHERELRKSGKKIRRRMDKSAVRVGHGGTLDVEAAGVLVLGINHGCKKLHGYLQGGKSYLAMGRLGVATDSYDAEGKVTKIAPTEGITAHGMEELLAEFTGEIMQRPPIYSAIRVDGMRLYQYARAGNKVPTDIKARKVNVKNIRLLHFANPQAGAEFGTPVALPEKFLEYFVTDRYAWVDGCPEMQEGMLMTPYVNQPDTASFQILIQSGGGGVYVRSLVHDIGERLGSAATMTSLLRTSQGPLRLDRDTIEIEDLVYVDRVRDAIAHAENVIRAAGAERS